MLDDKNNSEVNEREEKDLTLELSNSNIKEAVVEMTEKSEPIEEVLVNEEKVEKNEVIEENVLNVSDLNNSQDEDIDKKNLRKAKCETDISIVKESKNMKKKIFVICFCIIALLVILIGGFICYTKMYTNVFNNVYLFGENMSGKSQEEVIAFVTSLSGNVENLYKNDETGIDVYQDSDSIYKILPSDFEFKIDVAKTSQNIIEFGRENGVVTNSCDILKAMFGKVEFEPVYYYNKEKLDEILKNVELTLKNRFVDDKYSLDEINSKLVITRGITGNTINYEKEEKKLISLLSEKVKDNNIPNSLVLDIVTKKPAELNLDTVYSEVKREPKDAYIDETKNPIELVNEKVGYDFEVNKLKEELNKEENKVEGKVIEYALTIIEPKVKLSDITYTLYRDKIAGYTTYFIPGVYARSTNLKIALSYLNDKVIMPGETFSYNDAVGDVNAAKGYQAAAVFKGGTTVNEIGGGICQTTSTLYNVALMANLEIVERYQHGLPVGYVPPSRDATVYSPNLDFKFKNTRKYPIKIVTSFSYDGSLNISFYGTKEEVEYDVELSSRTLRIINFTTKYIYDESLPEGQQVIVSAGVNGYQSESYITKKLNGKVISSGLLSRDTYNAQQQIVKIGTKKQ